MGERRVRMSSDSEAGGDLNAAGTFAAVPLAGREGAIAAIYERRAVRSYTSEPLARDQIEALLDAASHAPSAVNLQPWVFVVIEDPELLRRYADEAVALYIEEPPALELTASGLPMLEELRKMVGGTDFVLFHGASAVIIIYATQSEGIPDCYLAAENLMLAAWAIGLGTCPIGLASPLFNRADVKAELGISPDCSVAVPIVVGHPSGPVSATPRRQVEVAAWR
jgi:nitroreductase